MSHRLGTAGVASEEVTCKPATTKPHTPVTTRSANQCKPTNQWVAHNSQTPHTVSLSSSACNDAKPTDSIVECCFVSNNGSVVCLEFAEGKRKMVEEGPTLCAKSMLIVQFPPQILYLDSCQIVQIQSLLIDCVLNDIFRRWFFTTTTDTTVHPTTAGLAQPLARQRLLRVIVLAATMSDDSDTQMVASLSQWEAGSKQVQPAPPRAASTARSHASSRPGRRLVASRGSSNNNSTNNSNNKHNKGRPPRSPRPVPPAAAPQRPLDARLP